MRIPGLRGLSARTVVALSFRDFLRDDMLTYAAALAYHLLIALFPFLIFVIALLGFFDLQALFGTLLEQAQRTLPPQAMAVVQRVLREVGGGQEGLLSAGALLSVWFASLGMRSAMNALNRAYDVREGRARWKRYSLSVLYTIAFAVLVVLATLLMVAGPSLAIAAAERLGVGGAALAAWRWLRAPAAILLVMLAAALVYHFAPNVEQRFRFTTPGSVVAVLLWLVVSFGFRFYVDNFGRYSLTYGSIGAVIVLLLYFFLSSAVLLFGGEVNSVIQQHAPESAPVRERDRPDPA